MRGTIAAPESSLLAPLFSLNVRCTEGMKLCLCAGNISVLFTCRCVRTSLVHFVSHYASITRARARGLPPLLALAHPVSCSIGDGDRRAQPSREGRDSILAGSIKHPAFAAFEGQFFIGRGAATSRFDGSLSMGARLEYGKENDREREREREKNGPAPKRNSV